MPDANPSFFDGVPRDEVEQILDRLERRRYPAGAVVIAEGETSHEIFITQSGGAEVFVADRQGMEHRVGRVGPGATLGEMSLFTGQPAVGTVRASDELEVLVLTESEFERVSSKFPGIYRTVGAILSDRLARTNRLALREEPGRLVVLEDHGAPPLLAYALACSVAWHTRASTLLVVVDDDPPEPLRALATVSPAPAEVAGHRSTANGDPRPGAQLMLAQRTGAFAPDLLGATTENLCATYDHVLIAAKGSVDGELPAFRTIHLAGRDGVGAAPRTTPAYTIRAWTGDGQRVGPDRASVLHAPELDHADERALKGGLLPSSTSAGRAVGWAARDLAGLKVGLALGGGSVRGYAHWGVLRAFERAGLFPDYLAGTSIGAVVAAMHALGYSAEEGVEIFVRGASRMFRPTLPIKSLLSSRALEKFIYSLGGDRRIEDLDLPLAIVAADILSQREVVFRRGLVWRAVLASVSIPGVYPAQPMGPYMLVDGGVLDPVPTSVVAEMGAETAIGVRLVSRPTKPDMDAESTDDSPRPPVSAVAAILGALESIHSRIAPEFTSANTIMITPRLQGVPSAKLRRFSVGLRYVEDGANAAEAALPRIAAALPWLRK